MVCNEGLLAFSPRVPLEVMTLNVRNVGVVTRGEKLDLGKCCEGERIYQDIYKLMNMDPLPAMSELFYKIGFFDLLDQDYQAIKKGDGKEDIGNHLRFSLLSRHILTREDFDRRFDAHPCLKSAWKETVWQHMTHCAVFFLNTYRELHDAIISIRDHDHSPETIQKIAKIIFSLLRLIEDYRHNFTFCKGCGHENPIQCSFWRQVALDIIHLQEDFDAETFALKLIDYFQKFKERCSISKYIIG